MVIYTTVLCNICRCGYCTVCDAIYPAYHVLGLQLMWGKNPPMKRAFTYALSPLTEHIYPVRNKVLVTEEVQGDHVRVQELQPSEKLAEILSDYHKNKYIKAVVIVNTTNSLILPAALEGLKSSSFPLLIVSKSDGHELLGILEDPDEVLCNIDVESTVDHPAQQLQTETEQIFGAGDAVPQSNKGTSPLVLTYLESLLCIETTLD